MPENAPAPPPAPEDREKNYAKLCRLRDKCNHPDTKRYFAQGYGLLCQTCGRRWRSLNEKWVVGDREDSLREPVSRRSQASSSRSRPAASTTPTHPVKSSANSNSSSAPSHTAKPVPTDEEMRTSEEEAEGWMKPSRVKPRQGPTW